MKRLLYAFSMLAMLVFASACSPPSHMLIKEDAGLNIRAIRPQNGKSALVIARTTNYGGAIEFDTYLDRKMIGVTQRKSFFVKTDVPPGTHYVIAKAENFEQVRIPFEENRVYYLLQIPRMGVWKARVSMAPLSTEELLSTWDDGVKYLEYDVKNPGDDLSEEDFKQVVEDYEREVKEGMHKDKEAYRGVKTSD
jgi:hypothetical protein